jgi:hypothetical protein
MWTAEAGLHSGVFARKTQNAGSAFGGILVFW